METFKTSFLELLHDIFEATRCREESEVDYQHLLRIFFKEGGMHDALRWEQYTRLSEDGYLLRKNLNYADVVTSKLRADIMLGKIFRKGGLQGTANADPEVDVEHLSIPIVEKVLGREHEVRKLLLKCCNPDVEGLQLCAIPIVGAAGMGKTTLDRLIYEHELVGNQFEMRVWVKVDGQEFNLHHAARELLKSAMGMACSIDDLDELDKMVRDSLHGRRCIIVFDGVESIAQDLWLHMNKNWLYFVDMGSMVLITTRSENVANLVSNEAFHLKHLLPDDGRSMYRFLAADSSSMMEALEDTSRNLEALYGYIPLLLKLVGNMMRYDDNLRHLLSEVHFSDAISLLTFDASIAILLCVWALPPQLRQCVALRSIFPKGYALDREKIINMWVAHGLVKSSPENNLRDIGDSYFHQLLCRSFFFTDVARNEYGEITDFWMPGLIHTIMQDVASIVWKGKLGVIGSISEDANQLSLHSESAGEHMPDDLRSLIFSSALYSGARSLDYTFLYFWELESLDLSCSGIRNLSDDICALRELKYLNLSYKLIERLPDSIRGLPQLQTLDLSWCYHFKVLPKVIRNLKYISHLDLFQCESLSYLPSGIGLLKSLTSMPLFLLGKDRDSAHLEELGLLNKLRGRLDIKNLENVREISEACEAKLKKKKLHHLGLYWSNNVGDCFKVMELLEPNQRLKSLDLAGFTNFHY